MVNRTTGNLNAEPQRPQRNAEANIFFFALLCVYQTYFFYSSNVIYVRRTLTVRRENQKSFDLMVIIALPLIIGTQFTAKRIMILVAGQEFADSGPVLQILILAAGFIFLGCMFAHGVIAINKQKKIIGAYIFTAITAIIGYLIFIV